MAEEASSVEDSEQLDVKSKTGSLTQKYSARMAGTKVSTIVQWYIYWLDGRQGRSYKVCSVSSLSSAYTNI
eukprot:scaffold747_cov120-Cylindrotheca_fusiformis.AAC.2